MQLQPIIARAWAGARERDPSPVVFAGKANEYSWLNDSDLGICYDSLDGDLDGEGVHGACTAIAVGCMNCVVCVQCIGQTRTLWQAR